MKKCHAEENILDIALAPMYKAFYAFMNDYNYAEELLWIYLSFILIGDPADTKARSIARTVSHDLCGKMARIRKKPSSR